MDPPQYSRLPATHLTQKTPTRSSQAAARASRQIPESANELFLGTPAHNHLDNRKAVSIEDLHAAERYLSIAGRISATGEDLEFDDLIRELKLEPEYNAYLKQTTGLFSNIVDTIPTLGSNYITYPNNSRKATSETQLFAAFSSILDRMMETDFSSFECAEPARDYTFYNHEKTMIAGSTIKPDGALFYKGHGPATDIFGVHILFEAKLAPCTHKLPNDVLGQMGDYAWTVWKAQPTRTFVPVFLIHGTNLTLFVFARSKHYRLEIGQFMYTSGYETLARRRGITEALHNLWFLLIQPPESFGHFVDISNKPRYLAFEDGKNQDSVARARKINDDDSAVNITKRIHKQIRLTRRAAYLFDTTYKDNRAVLKLSWSPSNRQPEGAIYDILSANNVSNIPEIYRSGIVIRDIFGFRLEYIIMSHCGESVEEWFSASNQSTSSKPKLNDDVHRIVQKVTTCLVQARKAGVLHRDISAGNIMITDTSVSVIDWGYGRAIDPAQTTGIKDINTKWGMDFNKITRIEKENDGNTGTPCYMGVRILMKQATRSLLDDIESLFYIVMALFSAIDRKSMDLNAPGFMVPRSNLAAALKVGFLSDDKNFPQHFGLDNCSSDEYQYLEAFRRLLFFAENKFIGGNLLTSTEQIRTADYGDVIKALLDPEHSQQCSDYQPPSDEHPQRSVANNDVAEPNAPMPVTVIIENAPTLVQTTALVQIDHHSHNSIVEPAKQHYSEAAALVTASWQPDVSRSESVPQAPHALQGASRLLSKQMKKHIKLLASIYSRSITDVEIHCDFMEAVHGISEFTMPYHCTAQYLLLIEEKLAEFPSFGDRVVFILVALHLHTSAIPLSAESGFNNSGTGNVPHNPTAQTNQSLASEIGRMGIQSVATSVSVADKENMGSRCFNSSPKRSFADTGFDTPIHPGATSSNKSRRIEGN